MGNICPWCCKDPDDSRSNNNLHESSSLRNSQRSTASSEANERTRLIGDSGNHNHRHPATTIDHNVPTSVEPSSLITPIVPPLPPPLLNDNRTESTTAKIPPNETAESSMATIVDRMLPDLIDVGGWGAGTHQTNSNTQNSNGQNDQLRQTLSKSLQSIRPASLPDAGTSNLSSLLSNRPVSSDVCHYVAHTASELSRLLMDEIKIIHKEDLVVTFE